MSDHEDGAEFDVWRDIILDPSDPGNIALAVTTGTSGTLVGLAVAGYVPETPALLIALGGWLHAVAVSSISAHQAFKRERELLRGGDRDE